MVKIKNNFEIVQDIIRKCDISVKILEKKKIKLRKDDFSIYRCIVNAEVKDISTGRLLFVENLFFDMIDNSNHYMENDLSIKKTDARLCFSMEEHLKNQMEEKYLSDLWQL